MKFNNITTINNVDELSGRQFELFTGGLLRKLNYRHVRVTKPSGDHGLDVLATDSMNNRIGIQCKLVAPHDLIGFKAIQETFTGKALYHTDVGIVLTNGRMIKSALKIARRLHIQCWNRDTLRGLLDISNNQSKIHQKSKSNNHTKIKHHRHRYHHHSINHHKRATSSHDGRVKYDLRNSIIKHGLTALAQGVGGYHRTKVAVRYLNKNGFAMSSNNVYDLFQRALAQSPKLRRLNNDYYDAVKTKQKENRIKSAEKYRRNKRARIDKIIKENIKLKNKNNKLSNCIK